jgi:hypothetical protein
MGREVRAVRALPASPTHREARARRVRILDWLDELTTDCPRKRSASISDQCHARCPDLPKVP